MYSYSAKVYYWLYFTNLSGWSGMYSTVPTILENLELLDNFLNLEKSAKSQGIWDMVREFFMTCHMVCDLLIDKLLFAYNV